MQACHIIVARRTVRFSTSTVGGTDWLSLALSQVSARVPRISGTGRAEGESAGWRDAHQRKRGAALDENSIRRQVSPGAHPCAGFGDGLDKKNRMASGNCDVFHWPKIKQGTLCLLRGSLANTLYAGQVQHSSQTHATKVPAVALPTKGLISSSFIPQDDVCCQSVDRCSPMKHHGLKSWTSVDRVAASVTTRSACCEQDVRCTLCSFHGALLSRRPSLFPCVLTVPPPNLKQAGAWCMPIKQARASLRLCYL